MGITERRLREKAAVRSAILTTAWQLVLRDGWQSLSIRKIAEAIEYSVPVIYDHFENKEAILAEFAKEGFLQVFKKMHQAKLRSDDPAEQLSAIAHAYWHFAFRNKEYFQLMYGVGMPGCEIEKCLPQIADFKSMVMGPITALIQKGENTNADPFLKYFTFWSILYGLISIKNMGNLPAHDEVNKMVLDDAINGFIKNL